MRLGYEEYFCLEPTVKGGNTYHILLLAKNLNGYRNLLNISTVASQNFYRKPRIGLEELRKYCDGLICTTACVGGIFSMEDKQVLSDTLEKLSSIFCVDFYLEMQPYLFDLQHDYNLRTCSLCKEEGDQLIITGDSHYIVSADKVYHGLWLKLNDECDYYGSGDYHLQTEKEMKKFFFLRPITAPIQIS